MVDMYRLKGLMNGTTLKQLEKELGFSNGSISKWGSSSPSVDKVKMVADYFSVTTDFLLGKGRQKKEPLQLDKVLAHYALGACFSSPAFYEDENIPIETPRNQIRWSKAVRSIERKAEGKLSFNRVNSFLKIATGYTGFEDDEYPSLEEYALLRGLAGKIDRFITMGGVSPDDCADAFLEHLKAIEASAKESDSEEYAAAIKNVVELAQKG